MFWITEQLKQSCVALDKLISKKKISDVVEVTQKEQVNCNVQNGGHCRENKDEPDVKRRGLIHPEGTYFPNVTIVLDIIPLITRLLASTEKNLTQFVFSQCICYRSKCFSAEKYRLPNRRRFSSPSSLLCSLFLFLTGDDNSSILVS